jgi:pimeloyl-ACP methyl ester carboxylesterase
VGHALGGLVALNFADRFPDLVDRMMLIETPFESQAVNPRLLTSPLADLADWLLERQPSSSAARVEAVKADAAVIPNSLTSLAASGLTHKLNGLKTPCLLVYGQNDPVITVPNPDAVSSDVYFIHQVILEQIGHFPMLDDAARFQRLLLDFLALESGASPHDLLMKEEWKRRVR